MLILIDILLRTLFAQLFEILTLYLSNCLNMLIVYKQLVFYIKEVASYRCWSPVATCLYMYSAIHVYFKHMYLYLWKA